MGATVKFGIYKGPEINMEFDVAASEVFKHLGGAFVYLDANNRIVIAGAGNTNIIGWAIAGDFTASSTAGQTKLPVNICRETLYKMRLDTSQTEAQLKALVGDTCDLVVTANIQYADIDASSDDVLEIVGYEYWGSAQDQQAVIVRLVPNNITVLGGVV